ncbi:MAG: DUF2130 domain-containing protein [Candidatus Margulisbacteria bacterium]|nr:DUF2130 domain-containing protein [Candidatus Margulisiibacteriota bacterium]
MNEIICPHCNKAFKIDEAGYADILKQVRNHEFEKELHNRLEMAEKDKENAVKLAQEKTKDEMIAYYKDMKAKLSTKMMGETLEQHCEIEFNRLRATVFKNVYFEKDEMWHFTKKKNESSGYGSLSIGIPKKSLLSQLEAEAERPTKS